jgi:putative DNA primase/helicase
MAATQQFLGELKQVRRWLLWRSEARNGVRATKVPCSAGGGRASSTDPGTWCTYEEAVAVVDHYEGMGFAVGDGTVLIDLDGCRDPETGAIQAWATEIISLFNAPAEISPSGSGVHIYVKSNSSRSVKHMFERKAKRGIEVYPHGRFSTITFDQLMGTPHELPYRDVDLFVQRVEKGDFDPEDVRELRINESCSRWERETKRRGRRLGTSFDLDRWLAENNVGVHTRKADGVIIITCPGTHGDYDRHDGRAFVKQMRSGAIAMGCLHASCSLANTNGNRWREFRRLVEGVSPGRSDTEHYRGTATPDLETPLRFSEDGLAACFTTLYAENLRYVAGWGKWMQYDGTRWVEDGTLEVFDKCRAICRKAGHECLREGNQAAAKQLASASSVAGVHRLATSDQRTAASTNQWDSSIYLLNTPGGAVDLCTGETRPCVREDFCTKITAVAPGGDCPLWKRFLGQVTDWNAELENFLQRMVGYSLTGCTSEECLFFLYGLGANGKSKFIGAISGMIGSYAKTAPIETFIASSGERHPTDLAGLQGARLVCAIETEQGRNWAESKVKTLTGGDPISARFMRQDFFEYVPQFKLVIVGNHKPSLRSVNEAIRRRFHLVPFNVTLPEAERDPDLAEKLRAEWPGILQWAIDGCISWYRDGLNPPAIVTAATAEYLANEDHVARWIEDCCVVGEREVAKTKALYKSYCEWCEANNEKPLSSKEFSPELDRKGYVVEHTVYGNVRRGIGLRSQSPEGN